MNLIPWKSRETGMNLFDELEDFQTEMNRLFDYNLHRSLGKGNGGAVLPAVDIVDEKDQIKVKAELPGMKKEDVEITVDHETLMIKGEKKTEKEMKEKDYIRSERYYGSFIRTFTLPAVVDSTKVNASYKDGILEIVLPKKEGAKPKLTKVDIK